MGIETGEGREQSKGAEWQQPRHGWNAWERSGVKFVSEVQSKTCWLGGANGLPIRPTGSGAWAAGIWLYQAALFGMHACMLGLRLLGLFLWKLASEFGPTPGE